MKVRPISVTFDAIRFAEDGSNWRDVCAFIGADLFWGDPDYTDHPEFLCLPSGEEDINRGWWVVRDARVPGVFLTFPDEEFVEKFEPVEGNHG